MGQGKNGALLWATRTTSVFDCDHGFIRRYGSYTKPSIHDSQCSHGSFGIQEELSTNFVWVELSPIQGSAFEANCLGWEL